MSRVNVLFSIEQSTTPAHAAGLGKQRGWKFGSADAPPGATAEDQMWLTRHRLQRAVIEFFRRNRSREYFVSAVTTVGCEAPGAPLARRVVIARYNNLKSSDRGCDPQLWPGLVDADAATCQFYFSQNDEETAG